MSRIATQAWFRPTRHLPASPGDASDEDPDAQRASNPSSQPLATGPAQTVLGHSATLIPASICVSRHHACMQPFDETASKETNQDIRTAGEETTQHMRNCGLSPGSDTMNVIARA